MDNSDEVILKSKLRAAWIEWLYIDDEKSRADQEKLIIQMQYKIFRDYSDTDEVFNEIKEELKKLPVPDWLQKIQLE
jgi:hypothetical protein